MRKILISLIIFSGLYSFEAFSQVDISKENLQKHIKILASDSLQGRKSGSEYEKKSAVYVRDYFKGLGLILLADEGIQHFDYSGMMMYNKKNKSQNVVVKIEGSDSILKKECIVIGAHYDHIGKGGLSSGNASRRLITARINRGADDNASGTAIIMELARNMKNHCSDLKRSVIFVAFGAEEAGLCGSEYFVDNKPEGTGKIIAMINFDMVGRMTKDKKLFVSGTETAAQFKDIIDSMPNHDNIDIEFFGTGNGSTDCESFYDAKIPVFSFITGIHKDYHTPGDVERKINYDGMEYIGRYAYELAMKLNYKDTIRYTVCKEPYPDMEIKIQEPWEFKGHMAGVYFGFNALTDKNNNFTIPEKYEFLETNIGHSAQIGFNLYSRGLKIFKNLGISYGAGIEFNNLYFESNTPVTCKGDSISSDSSLLLLHARVKKNSMSDTRITLPLMLEWKIPTSKSAFYLSAGVIGSMRLWTYIHVRYKYDDYRINRYTRGSYYTNLFNWSATARIGYGRLGFYASYQLSPLFEENAAPALYPFTAGVTLNF